MNTRLVSLSILAAAVLAACAEPAVRPPLEPAARIVPQPIAYRAGTGVIQNVTPAPQMGSAMAGGSAVTNRPEAPVGTEGNRAASSGPQRLTIKMDSGGDVQYVDTDGAGFQRGMRVELTPDHLIRKL